MEKIKALGGFLLGAVLLLAFVSLIAAFFAGATWVSEHLLPWLSNASLIAGTVLFLILLPLSIVKGARQITAPIILIVSYLFGITLWMLGFLVTLSTWGLFAVVFGLLIAGIGVVPIAMIAALFHGAWALLLELLALAVLTFGCRFFSIWAAESIES